MKRRYLPILATLGLLGATAPWTFLNAQDSAPEAEAAPAAEAPNAEQPDSTATPAPAAAAGGGENIEATVSQLEELIALPPTARLGRESDENLDKPRNLFETDEVRKSLLGPKPRYIYIPDGQDPMIIPWVREAIVAGEMLTDAGNLFKDAQAKKDKAIAQQALDKLKEVQKRYPTSPDATKAKAMEAEVTKYINQQNPDPSNPGQQPPLPPIETLPAWITNNTLGVILDKEQPGESVVLVGDYIIRPGEAVPKFPSVTVQEVQPALVIYDFGGKQWPIKVEPTQN